MIPRHLDPAYRRLFAPEAAHQRDAMRDAIPAMVRAGMIDVAAAQSLYCAWEAIARWFAGERIDFDIGFEEMANAAAQQLRAGEDACQAQPDNQTRAARRDAVAALYSLLQAHCDWLSELNRKLREDARRRLKEAAA